MSVPMVLATDAIREHAKTYHSGSDIRRLIYRLREEKKMPVEKDDVGRLWVPAHVVARIAQMLDERAGKP